MGNSGWFADTDSDAPDPSHPWQPCLETGVGHVPCFDIWFPTEAACVDWIKNYALDAPLLED